jgi:uncharacterized protein
LLTPTKITAWLDCDHSLTLQHQVEAGTLRLDGHGFGAFAQLLADKGRLHEQQCLDHYWTEGKSIYEVPQRRRGESFTDWMARLDDPLAGGHDVIYQLPLAHDGIRGIADFVLRVVDPDTGSVSYEPVDAKLARSEAKPGHVLQLCFYAEALEARTGVLPEHVHLWLGSGVIESIRTVDVLAYWRRLRTQLRALLDDESDSEADTVPVPCTHCEFCDFALVCDAQWRDDDSLVFVAGLRSADREALEQAHVTTVAALAELDPDTVVEGVRPERLTKVVAQAELQVAARALPDGDAPPHQVITAGEDPTWGHGFELMPAPDDGDVFLDFEGHPFWQPDGDLFFLFGWIERDDAGEWTYRTMWASDRDEEAAATRELIDYLATRRAAHPGMHVYHYNHTERSSLVRLSERYGVAQTTLAELIDTGAFVDLMTVAGNAVQVGTESYGLKHLERLTDFVRDHEIGAGAGAVIEYEAWMRDGDAEHLARIADYNEDDVRATLALRDWLVAQRPVGLDWRAAVVEVEEPLENFDEQIDALHAFGVGTPEHLLGDLLGYWAREGSTHKVQTLVHLDAGDQDRRDDPVVIAELGPGELVERVHKTQGTPITPGMAFQFPPQELAKGFDKDRAKVMYTALDGQTGYAAINEIDAEAGYLQLSWSERAEELGVVPDAVVLNDWVKPKPKPGVLSELAAQVLDADVHGAPNAATVALLRRDLPAFTAADGPAGGVFNEDLEAMRDWVRHLDHSCVAIQGPPGTGKTFRGAHLIHSLITSGHRVGITAFSHPAIGNLLAAVVDRFREEGDLEQLRAVSKRSVPHGGPLDRVTYVGGNPAAARDGYNLVAGTTWLFANAQMRANPVDVLVIDEAGQLALVDALVASTAAHNLVLLGDPLQLPQVAQASHPNRSGDSVLEHVLGDAQTMPADRGVFLSETRRMHPDVSEFISEAIYEGRITSYADCSLQGTKFGTGLRWLRADHSGCSTASPVEAELIADEVERLIGTTWTNDKGEVAPITAEDVMVVAPYNDQVDLLRDVLHARPSTRGVPVGTVDKFQGQEAAAVFFSMTASTAADAPRGAEFLFSRNRLNVAISRARCLAYLVCTEPLVNSRARSVEHMRLLATLCAFVEHTEQHRADTAGATP